MSDLGGGGPGGGMPPGTFGRLENTPGYRGEQPGQGAVLPGGTKRPGKGGVLARLAGLLRRRRKR